MDFLTLAKERYSVRKLDSREVEKEKLDSILQAAQLAPTACNKQPVHLFVVQTPEAMAKLGTCTPYLFGAPVAIIVCANADEEWVRPFDQDRSGVVDAAIVGTHIHLQVACCGLGTTWVGYFDPAKLVAEFQIPQNLTPIAIFPIGYPTAEAQPSPMHTQRKALEEMITYL